MKSFLYTSTAGMAAALMFGLAAPALGQGAATEEVAVEDASAQGNPEDIIVTAQRVEQRLQDVPVSITVFNQEQITNKNIVVASDLATYTPSLSVNTRFGPEKSSFAIRGFNQDAATAPTVGVYFADVVGVRAQGGTTGGNSAPAGSFVDLQNVQVLKGPQGTLFGRNTTGGAVLLVPRKPTGELEGFIEGTYGNYDQKRITAAVNIPLADTFKVRVAIDRNVRDGYMINRSGIGPAAFNDVDYFYGRLSVVADLTPDLENYTTAYYSRSRTEGYAARLLVCNNDATRPGLTADQIARVRQNLPLFTATGFNTLLATTGAACDQIARQNARGDSLTDVEVYQPDQSTGLKIDTWQVINTTTWRASDSLTIKNIASYGEYRENAGFNLNSDNFFLPAEFAAAGRAGLRFQYINLDAQPGFDAAAQSTFTEELQLQGNLGDGLFTYVFGGYLEFSRPIGFNQQRTGIFGNCSDAGTLNCTAPLGFVSISQSRTKFAFDNHGIFGQGTFKITDQLGLTLGARYTFDKVVGLSESTRYTLIAATATSPAFPLNQPCNDSVRNPGVNVLPTGDTSLCTTRLIVSSNKPTWNAVLEYKPIDDLMLYGKYSRGYRQGGINFTNPGFETYNPEKVDLFELGAKYTFRGPVRGYFNIAAFYNNFTDQQIFAQARARPGSGLAGGNVIINAGKSTIKGIEIDAAVTFFDSLRFDFGYTYLDAKVKQVASSADLQPLTVGTPFDLLIPQTNAGEPLSFSPKHRVSLTGTYTLPFDESVGKISVGATVLYTSEQFAASLAASPIGLLPETTLLNLNANWDSVGGLPIDLAAFATNVTNKKYLVGVGQGFNSAGFDSGIIAQPRMYGVRLKFRFGGGDRSEPASYAAPPPPPPPPPPPWKRSLRRRHLRRPRRPSPASAGSSELSSAAHAAENT